MMYKLPKKRLIIPSSNGINWTLSDVAKDGSSPAVSCLKLEPKVSSFPVLEANMASSTNATAKSSFIWACIYEGTVNEIGLCL